MKHIFLSLACILVPAAMMAQGSLKLIPQPAEVVTSEGHFAINEAELIINDDVDARTSAMISTFISHLSEVSGLKFTGGSNGRIEFAGDSGIAAEGYSINVSEKGVRVAAADYNGFFYAIQTLKQMLPTAVYSFVQKRNDEWTLPYCTINDAPRFKYRGMLLDCGRHFWTVDQVKKCLDIMAAYKLNRLHWHLTEDQGWRIEIKKYPRLTEVGAWRNGTMIGKDYSTNDGIRYGGFYTQDQIRDVVKYASDRGITITPEIDLPGHMQAALASYPELGCAGSKPQPYQVRTTWGVSNQVLCVGKESTMKFLEDVVSEAADLFPGEYFHIGGDECPRKEWASDPDCQTKIKELGLVSDKKCSAEARLQNYVTARIQKTLAAKGKKIIGWDEVLEGELAEGVVVMSWRGTKGGIKASKMGHDVIMAPNLYCYIDHCQSEDVNSEPLCITNPAKPERAVTIEKMYGWDPYDGIAPEYQKHIIGPQANLWTEFIGTMDYLEYMMLPRLLAMSEIQWCTTQNRNFERFNKSLREHHFNILKTAGYNFRSK